MKRTEKIQKLSLLYRRSDLAFPVTPNRRPPRWSMPIIYTMVTETW
jgi:hypothetical protein